MNIENEQEEQKEEVQEVQEKDIVIPKEPEVTKRRFRWIFRVDGVDEFMFSKMQGPSFSNSGTTPSNFNATLYDSVDSKNTKSFYKWLKNKDRRSATLLFLDSNGSITETWLYKGLQIVDISFGQLDYKSSDPLEITILFKPESIELL